MEAATARLGRRKARKRKSYGSEERRLAALLLSPAMIVIALVAAYPIGYAVWLSLTEYSVRVPGKWRFAGFDNYTKAFGSTEFWDAVKNTFIFTGLSVTLELVIGLGMALAMHAAFKGRGLLRTVVLVPWAVLTVVSAITWRTLFEPNLGLAPTVLGKLGIAENVVWLGQSGYAMAVMVLADVWKTAPFMALLLLAGLQVIPDDVYDVAALPAHHAAPPRTGDPRGIDLPHARRAADLRPAVRPHGRHQRHLDAVADRAAGAHDQQPDRLRLGAVGADVRDR